MKKFAVTVAIQTGGYEKSTLTLVEAEHGPAAERAALLAECHADIGEGAEWVEGETSISDCNGDFIYSVSRVREITDEEYALLKEYL